MDLTEKILEVLEHLRSHPLDYTGCAKILDMEFLEFMELRGLHLKRFMEVEEESYNILEHLVMMDAMGQELPEKYKNYDFQKARHVLACRKGWNATSKIQRVPVKPAEPTGKGKQLVDDYLSKKKIGDMDGTGIKILSTTARRNMQ